MRIPYISLLAAGSLALGGCAYGGLGLGTGYGSPYGYGGYSSYGYGSPYYGYGYNSGPSISIGVGSYYGSRYGGYYGNPYGYGGYGSPYYGWYNNYYYPGTGYYVYDVNRRPYAMTTTQRQYWSQRSPALRTNSTTRSVSVKPNWGAFENRKATRIDRQTARFERQSARAGRQSARVERQSTRNERKADRTDRRDNR